MSWLVKGNDRKREGLARGEGATSSKTIERRRRAAGAPRSLRCRCAGSRSASRRVANDRVDFEAEVGEVRCAARRERARRPDERPHRPVPARRGRDRASTEDPCASTGHGADAIEAGIGMVHQHFLPVQPLTVAENVLLGWHTPRFWLDQKSGRRQVREVSEMLGMRVDPNARLAALGRRAAGGDRKAVFQHRCARTRRADGGPHPQEADGLFETSGSWRTKDTR